MKKLFMIVAGAILGSLAANAVPAKPGYRTFEQPDGTVVEAMLVGDEYSHYYVDRDGVAMLMDAEGVLRYAIVDNYGNVTVSDVVAASASRRSLAQSSFVKSVNTSEVKQALARRAAESRELRTSQRRAKANVSAADDYKGLGLFTTNYPRTGKVRSLVFLVEYTDVKFKVADPSSYYNDLLNKEGFNQHGGTGSVRDYFLDQSEGRFDVTFDVMGPLTLKHNMAYYGANDSYYDEDVRPEEMVIEAMEQLKDVVDFSQYDFDNDGNIDNIYVIYAGLGEASGGSDDSVWPHSFEITNHNTLYNGKKVYGYACSNERGIDGVPDGIGNICHEFSHVMGLPDLYDVYYEVESTPGSWSVMDSGSYNNDGRTPPCYSAYERNAMGWLEPVILNGAATIQLDPMDESNSCCLIPTAQPQEFFLLENRQQQGWDTHLPGHGLVVWHIDFVQSVWDANRVNVKAAHQYVDLVEANNRGGQTSASAKAGFAFPGTSRITSFTSSTTPALKDWNNKAIDLPITEINENGKVVVFNVAGGLVELDTPEAPELTASDNGKMLVRWNTVNLATDYRITVSYTDASGARKVLEPYADYSVGNVTSFIIDNLESKTEYFVSVRAARGANVSDPSAETSVITPEIAFEYTAPVASIPVGTGTGSLVLSWKELLNAHHYLLTVEKEVGSGSSNINTGFGSGNKLTLPDGWKWSGTSSDIYKTTSTNYFGESAPSLKFAKNGANLVTEVFDDKVVSLSFWLVGAGTASKSNSFIVEGRASEDDTWTELMTITDLSSLDAKGSTFTVTPENDVRQIRFFYSKTQGNVGLDDVVIEFEDLSYEKDMDRVNVGSVTNYTYTLPDGITNIRYYVEGVHEDGTVSRPSQVLSGSATSGVELPALTPDEDAEYFNLQGIRVSSPSNGVFIERRGGVVRKVIL